MNSFIELADGTQITYLHVAVASHPGADIAVAVKSLMTAKNRAELVDVNVIGAIGESTPKQVLVEVRTRTRSDA